MDHPCLLQFSITRRIITLPIPFTAGTNPDTVGVSGTIKFHSPFVFSVQTGSKGSDEAPTPNWDGWINLTANQ